MEKQITKEEADRLMAIPGNVRGAIFLTNSEYIRKRGGEEGIKEIEERLKELDHPFLFKNIKQMEYYPEGISVLVILLAIELLNLDEEDVFEMGKAAAKLSVFMKILTKYFISIKKCFEESPRYWQKHFDFGRIEIVEFNEVKKYGIFRVRGYKFHPIMCTYHRGYFLQIAQLAVGRQTARIEETKCMFKGDPYHEYLIKWG
jgi:predicted hydrocarbon binding protein